LELLRGSHTAGTTYEFGGPQVYSFKALLELLLTALERQRILLPIPFPLAELQAAVLELLPKEHLLYRGSRCQAVASLISASDNEHTSDRNQSAAAPGAF
jgi:uncharacterized protein YbjT (DUF2867 family)